MPAYAKTLSHLVAQGNDASMHFYFANLANMHKHLFPALMQVYDTWVTRGGREAIEEMVPASEAHWDALADRALEIYRKDPGAFAATLKALFESRKFQNLD